MRFIEPVQVLVSDINIGYEEIVNTQVIKAYSSVVTSMPFLSHFLQYIVAGSSNDNVCSALLW
jgi:Na+/citrate or Na+/malate symporter